jgi:glutathione synthase/RimK-type ligase-like ATP-grasp enzyme
MVNSRLVIYPYKMGSQSAKNLAQAVTTIIGAKVRRVKEQGRYRPKPSRSIILNWGNARIPRFAVIYGDESDRTWWLNEPLVVARASNKLEAFGVFKKAEIPTPEWTTDKEVARQWLLQNKIVLSRTMLNSHSGRGIYINRPQEDGRLPIREAPLYVLYKRKKKEFRVHVFNGTVIDVAEKRKFNTTRRPIDFNNLVRNHDNGWSFCRESIQEPGDLRQLAISSVACLGLNFGACDIIWNEKENKCYTLEVNTAPGLEGTTLERYSQAIARFVLTNRV